VPLPAEGIGVETVDTPLLPHPPLAIDKGKLGVGTTNPSAKAGLTNSSRAIKIFFISINLCN
jgi:hypothetical protein